MVDSKLCDSEQISYKLGAPQSCASEYHRELACPFLTTECSVKLGRNAKANTSSKEEVCLEDMYKFSKIFLTLNIFAIINI